MFVTMLFTNAQTLKFMNRTKLVSFSLTWILSENKKVQFKGFKRSHPRTVIGQFWSTLSVSSFHSTLAVYVSSKNSPVKDVLEDWYKWGIMGRFGQMDGHCVVAWISPFFSSQLYRKYKKYATARKCRKMHLYVSVMSIRVSKRSHNPLLAPLFSQFLECMRNYDWWVTMVCWFSFTQNSFW